MKVDLNKVFYGEDAAEKLRQFKEGMLDIEKKNLDYFDNRSSKNDIEKKDRLHNHYLMTVNTRGITFGFINNSDLDEEIKTSCFKLFNSIFNSTN